MTNSNEIDIVKYRAHTYNDRRFFFFSINLSVGALHLVLYPASFGINPVMAADSLKANDNNGYQFLTFKITLIHPLLIRPMALLAICVESNSQLSDNFGNTWMKWKSVEIMRK